MSPEELMKLAMKALRNAVAPYSKFKVGAAVLTKSGKVFTGCNIENSSLGLTVCAEKVAVFKAISEGGKIKEIAVASITGESSPCGSCRQVIYDSNKNAIVYYQKDGKLIKKNIGQLLPDPFSLCS